MRQVTGTITVVQEGRFMLLSENGRGLLFLLHHAAPIEPQDLPALLRRRVRVSYQASPRLIAGVAHNLAVVEEPERLA